jgi:hypothetical protein
MPVPTDKDVSLKTIKAIEDLRHASAVLRECESRALGVNAPEYYRARNLLREARALFQEALGEAKKLMGPIPDYAPANLAETKKRRLETSGLAARGLTADELKSELREDPFLSGIMTAEEIEAAVARNFESQRSGKRQLANLKARIALDKLAAEIRGADALDKACRQRLL